MLSFVWDEDLETPEDLVTQKELGTESESETEAGTDPEVAEADLSEMLRILYLFQRRYLCTWLPLDLVTIITLALLLGAEGMQHRVDPIRKVVTVLQMMQNKVEAEGVPRDREGGLAP